MSLGRPSDSLSSLGRSGKELTGQSIVKALDEFMGAMHRMNDVVMIPSRLKDLEAPLPGAAFAPPSAPPSRASSSATLAVLLEKAPPPPPRAPSVDGGSSGSSAPGDLFSYYRMLDGVRQELVCGESEELAALASGLGDSGLGSLGETDDDLSSLDSVDLRESESTRLAATFRQHLTGLYSVMHQLTQTANLVSDKYTDNVRGHPSA